MSEKAAENMTGHQGHAGVAAKEGMATKDPLATGPTFMQDILAALPPIIGICARAELACRRASDSDEARAASKEIQEAINDLKRAMPIESWKKVVTKAEAVNLSNVEKTLCKTDSTRKSIPISGREPWRTKRYTHPTSNEQLTPSETAVAQPQRQPGLKKEEDEADADLAASATGPEPSVSTTAKAKRTHSEAFTWAYLTDPVNHLFCSDPELLAELQDAAAPIPGRTINPFPGAIVVGRGKLRPIGTPEPIYAYTTRSRNGDSLSISYRLTGVSTAYSLKEIQGWKINWVEPFGYFVRELDAEDARSTIRAVVLEIMEKQYPGQYVSVTEQDLGLAKRTIEKMLTLQDQN